MHSNFYSSEETKKIQIPNYTPMDFICKSNNQKTIKVYCNKRVGLLEGLSQFWLIVICHDRY